MGFWDQFNPGNMVKKGVGTFWGQTGGRQTPKPAAAYPAPRPGGPDISQYGGYNDLATKVKNTAPAEPAPAAPGVLSTPGTQEQWGAANKERLANPYAGEGVMGEAAGFFRGPNLTRDFAQGALGPNGYFNQPGQREGYAGRQLPGMENTKSYQEQLYESGNQGLNTFYDRERDKRQKRLEDQMAGMGVFGSGATARGMFELEAELGAQQARDMAGLAGQADAGRIARFGEARATAGAGDEGGIDRFKGGAEIGNLADASVDRQGRGLFNVGKGMTDAALDRDTFAEGVADRSQRNTERRERYPIEDAKDLAGAQAGINERGTGAISDEQKTIAMDQVQTLLANGTITAEEAAAISEMIQQGEGNVLKILEMMA